MAYYDPSEVPRVNFSPGQYRDRDEPLVPRDERFPRLVLAVVLAIIALVLGSVALLFLIAAISAF